MASYLETLMADRERMRRALSAQIEQETTTICQLEADLEKYSQELDEKIVRLMIYRGIFGSTQQETLGAQVEAEEASKPHALAREELAHHQKILKAMQEALAKLQATGSIEGTPSPGQGKLTVADLLGE